MCQPKSYKLFIFYTLKKYKFTLKTCVLLLFILYFWWHKNFLFRWYLLLNTYPACSIIVSEGARVYVYNVATIWLKLTPPTPTDEMRYSRLWYTHWIISYMRICHTNISHHDKKFTHSKQKSQIFYLTFFNMIQTRQRTEKTKNCNNNMQKRKMCL